jgi:23S rRNA pseudouridine2605 synthase
MALFPELLDAGRHMPLERIQKVLARAGVASRRAAEEMILEGRVTVNGDRVEVLGLKVDPLRDHIKVDGKLISHMESPVVLLLNKPKNTVSTVKDPQGRPTVMGLLEGVKERVYPVGRLDYDAEGLLILTNDGELAQMLSHPKYSVVRTYLAKVRGGLDAKALNRLKRGVMLEDGRSQARFVDVIAERGRNSWVRIGVTEGRNHLIKRMLMAVGHPVLKLKRVAFGPIQLEGLPPGSFRHLRKEEIAKLKASGTKDRVRRSPACRSGRAFGVRSQKQKSKL